MFKIDKTLVDNMNLNKSFIVITNKDNKETKEKKRDMEISKSIREEIPPDIKIKAQNLLKNAADEAEEIVIKAKQEAEEIKKKAAQQGYNEGMRQAEQKIGEQLKDEVATLKGVLDRLELYKQELLGEMQDCVLHLSLDIAEKIVNIQLERDDIVYVGIVKRAIEKLQSEKKFALRVSRSEHDRYFENGANWLWEEIGCEPFDVVCDPTMQQGDLVIESDEKVVDAGIGLQMKKVEYALGEKAE